MPGGIPSTRLKKSFRILLEGTDNSDKTTYGSDYPVILKIHYISKPSTINNKSIINEK